MGVIRYSVLGLALVLASPALYQALVTEDLDLTSALIRYLIAVPVAAVMLAGLRLVTSGYGEPAAAPGGLSLQPSPLAEEPTTPQPSAQLES